MFNWHKRNPGVVLAMVIGLTGSVSAAGLVPPTPEAQISVDQVGYYPQDPAKVAYVFSANNIEWMRKFYPLPTRVTAFDVRDAVTGRSVYTGTLQGGFQDYPEVNVADFSSVTQPGQYYITAAGVKSLSFRISNDLYDGAFYKAMRHFTYQREGDTTLNIEGYPTFLDDGKRSDNGTHRDVVGGWNDAGDVRRWTFCLGYGLLGLPTVQEIAQPDIDILAYNSIGSNGISDFLDEAKWGAVYFLKMQDEATGMLYPYCGADNTNYTTDNIIGTKDDREIVVIRDPGHNFHHKLFIQYEAAAGLAALSREYYPVDRAYAVELRHAAERMWRYIDTVEPAEPIEASDELAFKIMAGVNMYRMATMQGLPDDARDTYGKRTLETTAKLLRLQQTEYVGGQKLVRGWFRYAPGVFALAGGYPAYSSGFTLLSLVGLIDAFPTRPEALQCKQAVIMYIRDYLRPFAERNPFGYIPVELRNDDPDPPYTMRRIKSSTIQYRYFMGPHLWRVGNNGGLLSHAAALLAAAHSPVLNMEPQLKLFSTRLASRYIHIIHGANPANKSFIRDVGQTQTPVYYSRSRDNLNIPGALIAGDAGDQWDMPAVVSNYQSLEPWTPYNTFYLWAMAYYRRLVLNGTSQGEHTAPTLLSAMVDTDGVTLKFTTRPNAFYYKVNYGTRKDQYEKSTFAITSPFIIKGLSKGTFWIGVTAVDANGESLDSNRIQVTITN